MFKTIQQCRLDLVAHSVVVAPKHSLLQLIKPGTTDPLDQFVLFPHEQSLDSMPASAARVSFGKEDKTGQDPAADKKLMKYLADHEHMTPFEHQSATFLVEVPLFIRSQIMRHRTFAYNEISRRYTDENLEFWVPDVFRKQAANNRQASADTAVNDHEDMVGLYKANCEVALEDYGTLVAYGVCREQARAVLPQSLLTKFYMTGNLRNWVHFIRLRKDSHAQKEVQVVAERIEAELRKLWPTAVGVLLDKEVAIAEEAVKT